MLHYIFNFIPQKYRLLRRLKAKITYLWSFAMVEHQIAVIFFEKRNKKAKIFTKFH